MDATRRVIGVGFKIILQYEHGIRPYARKTQNPYDKQKKYKFIKVTRYIHMAIRLYALWFNITITEATCRIVAVGLRKFKDNDTPDNQPDLLDPLNKASLYDHFRKNYEGEEDMMY